MRRPPKCHFPLGGRENATGGCANRIYTVKWFVMNLPALAACLLLSAACPALSFAAEPSPEAAPTEAAPPETASPIDNTSQPMIVDRTHAYLERGILNSVIWFDDFFGNVKTEDVRKPEYLLRWRNSLRWEEAGKFKFLTSVRANLRLPKISSRLRLVVSGESEAEPTPGLPEDPGNPGFDRTLQNTRLVNTELRYVAVKKEDIDLFLGAGVRVKIPAEYFVRGRFQLIHRLGDIALLRFAETVFWKDTVGLGETTEIDLERQLRPGTLLRWANSATLSEDSRGLEWGTELSVLQQLSPLSAISLAGGVFGITRPVGVVDSYKISSRYRRNFLRDWLFFELEPEITWPRSPAASYTSALAFTFRTEIVFKGSGAYPSIKARPAP
jgi:hypothetical protein